MGKKRNLNILLPSFLLLASLLTGTNAVQYTVTNNAVNTPGGKRFDAELGVPWTLGLMPVMNQFIWALFQQPTNATRKPVAVLNVYISNFTGAMGYTNGDNINISAQAIASFQPKQTKFWFTSLLLHEMTHILQWSGRGTAPRGLTEGIADYVTLWSRFYDPKTYTKPGEGKRWDEGYGVTARFLEYCDTLRPLFTSALNNRMRDVYKDDYFLELLGTPLPQVWAEYKAKYGNTPAEGRGALPAV